MVMAEQASGGPALAIIVAGGVGSRFGRSEGKQLASIAGAPMLAHTVDAFRRAGSIGHIVLVCHPDRVDEYRDAVGGLRESTPVSVVPGGETRQDSVASGLRHMPEGHEIVAVHDGARPLVLPETIDRAVAALLEDRSIGGVVVGHPAFDTLKLVESAVVEETPDRSRFWIAQTPQVFRTEVLLEAHAQATTSGEFGTDDSAIVERIGETVVMLEGPRDNFKVTVEEDVALAEAVLRFRESDAEGGWA
jgi:2-C-methyl-D-erythritol 4-phosphate cytidylyltransferase